jgi:hypothetical protein
MAISSQTNPAFTTPTVSSSALELALLHNKDEEL